MFLHLSLYLSMDYKFNYLQGMSLGVPHDYKSQFLKNLMYFFSSNLLFFLFSPNLVNGTTFHLVAETEI